SGRLYPTPAAEKIEMDPDRDQHRDEPDNKCVGRRLQDADQVSEVHAVETREEAQGKEEARDHGQGLRGLVETVRNRRKVHIHRARQQVAESICRFVLTYGEVIHLTVVTRTV